MSAASACEARRSFLRRRSFSPAATSLVPVPRRACQTATAGPRYQTGSRSNRPKYAARHRPFEFDSDGPTAHRIRAGWSAQTHTREGGKAAQASRSSRVAAQSGRLARAAFILARRGMAKRRQAGKSPWGRATCSTGPPLRPRLPRRRRRSRSRQQRLQGRGGHSPTMAVARARIAAKSPRLPSWAADQRARNCRLPRPPAEAGPAAITPVRGWQALRETGRLGGPAAISLRFPSSAPKPEVRTRSVAARPYETSEIGDT